jgi:membrane-bound serine protease (ClpP class)
MRKVARISLLLLYLLIATLAITGSVSASPSPEVDILHVNGDIVPAVASYIDRGISQAEENQAAAVIIELNTSGGLLSPTEKIVDRILDAKVPVVVYVDQWAGSAGTFITLAANVAAMAPGSRIGAPSPVSTQGELSQIVQNKLTQDTAARITSLADLRGRNQAAAEAAVVEALSFTDQEALGIAPLPSSDQTLLGLTSPYLSPPLVDLGANNIDSLIAQLNGRTVNVAGEQVTINTEGYVKNDVGMSAIENFLQAISHPDIAYVLLALAVTGIILELVNPGAILPGLLGAISLILAFYSFAILGASWAGVFLIIFGFILLALEAFVTSFGILIIGGIASLIMGSIILFGGGPQLFKLQVDWWVIALVVIVFGAIFIFVIGAIVRAHRRRPTTGREGLIGKTAVTHTALDPTGMVFVEGELWTAISEAGKIEVGEEVVVTKIEGLKLRVTKKQQGG